MTTTLDPAPAAKVADISGYFQSINAISADAVAILRAYMQDTPDANKLIEGQEFKDQELRIAIAKGVSDINSVAPTSVNFGAAQFAGIPLTFFLIFCSIAATEMALHRRLRNDVQYSDGGVTVDTEKFDKYMRLIDQLRAYYYEQVKKFKMSINLEGISGYLPSAYLFEYVRI
jgi:hypothetical protein